MAGADSAQALVDSFARFCGWEKEVERVAAEIRRGNESAERNEIQRMLDYETGRRMFSVGKMYRDKLAAQRVSPTTFVLYALTGAVLGAGATAVGFVA